MISNHVDQFLNWYFASFPIERGKWRVWELLRRYGQPTRGLSVVKSIGDGITMKLNLDEYIDRFIYYWNCFEPNETWVLKRLLRPGDTFVDVGANIGYFTLLASRLVGPRGKVIAFEAAPPTLARLEENVALNPGLENISIHGCAVANTSGTIRIGKSFAGGSGTSSIRVNERTEQVWNVPVVSLDQVLADERMIRVVKIDVEGAELLVLKGFIDHLTPASAPDVFCEVDSDALLRELGGCVAELYRLMIDLGYHAYDCHNLAFSAIGLEEVRRLDGVKVLFSKRLLAQ